MDKLKTKVLFVSLIILALLSVSAVAAADSDVDVISDAQDDFDLSEETVSDVAEISDNAQDGAVLSAVSTDSSDDDQLKAEGDPCTVVAYFEIRNGTGDIVTVNITNDSVPYGSTWTLRYQTFNTTYGKNVETKSEYSYLFDHWVNATGETVTKNQYLVGTGEDYSVTFTAIYQESRNSNVTLIYEVMDSTGRKNITGTSNILTYNSRTWTMGATEMNNLAQNYKSCDLDGYHYTFDHWEYNGETVTKPPKAVWDGTDQNVTLIAIYNKELIGNHTIEYIDNLGNGGGSETHIGQYGVSYTHTFKEPADIPSGAKFLYWERADTKDIFYPGDKYSGPYSDIAGKNVVVTVYAVYDIYTQIELEEITGYVGDSADITATITDKVKNKPVPGGSATLTVDYTERLSNGKLMANTYTDTVDVDADGKAVFKNVPLENPGTYKYTVEYSGYSYNHHEEGINDYLASEKDSKLNILPLNTTTSSEDVSGTAGEKVTITADIVDQNGNPVQNGTAVLKVNGKEYTVNVTNGKATFTGVELPSKSTEATIEYLGNDYYNPSNTTIQITIPEPEEEPEDESEDQPEEEPEDEPEEEPDTPVAEKTVPATPAAGNPIALVVLALLTLVSTVSLGRKK